MTLYVDHVFRFDHMGRTATTDRLDYVHDLVEQLLFTEPGERVNRPQLGSGMLQLVFAPNSGELAAAVEFTTQAALEQWLGEVVDIEHLAVSAEEATLRVELTYSVRTTGQVVTESFQRDAG